MAGASVSGLCTVFSGDRNTGHWRSALLFQHVQEVPER